MKRSAIGRALRMETAWPVPRHTVRIIAALSLTIGFLWLLSLRLALLDATEVFHAFANVPVANWATALIATSVSFWAVGQYDACLHRHIGTGEAPHQAHRAGIAAIALGQTLGLGVLTGALIRWRMLPSLSLIQATKLSAAVALSFLFGWSIITALTLLALPAAPLKLPALMVCGLGSVVALLCLFQPRLRLFGRHIALPNIFTLGQILIFALIDTVAAALALWLLCPPDLGMPFATLLPAYLLALGAGLVSGTPGGVGAFEMTLLAALPTLPEPALIAGVLAFRLAYYALPAMLAAFAVLMMPPQMPKAAMAQVLAKDAPAEAGLIAQNLFTLLNITNKSQILMSETPHATVTLLDPFGTQNPTRTLVALSKHARARSRLPCLYKCGKRLAAIARRAGWCVAPVAAEAWLNPLTFTLNGAEKSALRRKLRKAEKSGLHIHEMTAADWPSLTEIAQDWAFDNGGERGFSMGRFGHGLLSSQRVFGAYSNGILMGFVSFHHNRREWALDLMRHRRTMPDGANYALVVHALQVARDQGIARFSLAAAPRLPKWLVRLTRTNGGLCQFKSAFGPVWQPLYIAAPYLPALALASAEIYRAIHHPPPLNDQPFLGGENKIASNGQPWHMRGNERARVPTRRPDRQPHMAQGRIKHD
ncbi:phosphatidylglycerol lysyltransferase domain-containing protein [Pseudorhodobacter sp. W20_MBD10_FR17]|uniref:phosphatidylglycerol lysyltransferase domain-containing protein n=1 Tax=Pseudorhodobacter sp. W20_MBD10_FR17 TaxID=3240266 RepID=UPI003F959E93